MKISRIVKKRTNKRDTFGFLLFVFLLPYVCSCLWGHAGEGIKDKMADKENSKDRQEAASCLIDVEMDWGIWEMPVEEYLVYRLAGVMQEDYEPEALKAQAVLLRTELVETYLQAENAEIQKIAVADDGIGIFYHENSNEDLDIYQEAVEQTKGIYLSYQGKPIRVGYFKVSNGHTRSAGEVWHTDEYPYLSSVVCKQDSASGEWKSSVTVDKNTYIFLLKQTVGEDWDEETLWNGGTFSYDDAGYVTEVLYTEDDKTITVNGEEFRYLFGLQSASFQIDWETDQVNFTVTGAGHGFGMSQYAANCKALNGDSYDQILKFFFKDTELAKIE